MTDERTDGHLYFLSRLQKTFDSPSTILIRVNISYRKLNFYLKVDSYSFALSHNIQQEQDFIHFHEEILSNLEGLQVNNLHTVHIYIGILNSELDNFAMSVCYIKGTCIINTLNFGGRHDSRIVQARAPYTVSDRQTRVTVAVRGRHPPRPVWVHQTVDSQAKCLPLCVKQTVCRLSQENGLFDSLYQANSSLFFANVCVM